jgi:hypothetical protein
MSSVAEIENAIQQLSIAEQRIIARHLGASLRARRDSKAPAAAHEGIPFIEHDLCPTVGGSAEEEGPKPSKRRGRSHATDLM